MGAPPQWTQPHRIASLKRWSLHPIPSMSSILRVALSRKIQRSRGPRPDCSTPSTRGCNLPGLALAGGGDQRLPEAAVCGTHHRVHVQHHQREAHRHPRVRIQEGAPGPWSPTYVGPPHSDSTFPRQLARGSHVLVMPQISIHNRCARDVGLIRICTLSS